MRAYGLRAIQALAAAVLMSILAVSATALANDHGVGVHRGGRVVVPGSTIIPVYTPFAYSPYYWGGPFWDPWYDHYYGHFPGFPEQGKIKLHDRNKEDQVYVNGALAGSTGKVKTMKLPPGNYTVEVKRGTTDLLRQRVYLLEGKTVQLDVE